MKARHSATTMLHRPAQLGVEHEQVRFTSQPASIHLLMSRTLVLLSPTSTPIARSLRRRSPHNSRHISVQHQFPRPSRLESPLSWRISQAHRHFASPRQCVSGLQLPMRSPRLRDQWPPDCLSSRAAAVFQQDSMTVMLLSPVVMVDPSAVV